MKTALLLVIILLFIGGECCKDKFKAAKCENMKEKKRCGQRLGKSHCKKTCGHCPQAQAAKAKVVLSKEE
jgi:hypothetical protein